jgi:hypothetical protein
VTLLVRLLTGLAAVGSALTAQVVLTGRVTNENNAPLPQARISVKKPDGATVTRAADPVGAFSIRLSEEGDYRLSVDRDGYFRMSERAFHLTEGPNEVHLILSPLREVFEAVDVTAAHSTVSLEQANSEQSMSGAEMLAVPFPASNTLKNAFRVMPGIVQDVRGGVHLNGGAEEQTVFLLNGFNINDPITGRFESRMGVEAVQAVDIGNGILPAQFGKGAAGAISITTTPGDDKFRRSATNFFPGFESHKGFYLGNWSPRVNLSGPIRKGRAWFSDSIAAQYDQQVLEELPEGADRMSAWRLSNYLHSQVNLTPSQILYTGLLLNGWWAPRTGLGILNPRETTIDRRSNQWFFNIKDQIYLGRGSLIEFGYAANRTYGREIPQGSQLFHMTPDGNSGNAYIDATRKAGRDQWLLNGIAPAFIQWGTHQIRAGLDVDRLTFWQNTRRTGLEQFRPDGSLVRRVLYGGRNELSGSNVEVSAYLQDSWRWRPDILVEVGVHSDWDRILQSWQASPRIGFAWSPFGRTRTKISAGYAVVHEATNLRLYTKPLDQYALTSYFDPTGLLIRGPAITEFEYGASRPTSPKAQNWSTGFEQEWVNGASLRLGYLRRRGNRGFTYANRLQSGSVQTEASIQSPQVFDAIYTLGNDRRDVFDSFEVTLRQSLRKQYGWLASYTRSRALSNGVVDVNIDDPTTVLKNVGPMPWDAPHRFLGWAYLPLFWKDWALASMLETRSGFPFSVQGGDGAVQAVNSQRFPKFFELNLHGERRFVFRGHRWEFRAGMNNLTNHRNPNVVNGNIDSRNFMRFYGGQRRSLNFRIRWLGKITR